MKSKLFILLLSGIGVLTGAVVGSEEKPQTTQSSTKQNLPADLVLENNSLKMLVRIGSNAGIVSLTDKRTGQEQLQKLDEQEFQFSPLVPPHLVSNRAGYKEWLWGENNPIRVPFTLIDQGKDEQGQWLIAEGVMNKVSVRRKMTLLKQYPVILVEAELTGDRDRAAAYWLHLVCNPELFLSEDGSAGAVAGDFAVEEGSRQNRAIEKIDQGGLKRIQTEFADYAFAPRGNWFVRIQNSDKGGIMVIVDSAFQQSTESFFYTWQNPQTASLEAVWPLVKLSAAEPAAVRYLIVILDHTEIQDLEAAAHKYVKHLNRQ